MPTTVPAARACRPYRRQLYADALPTLGTPEPVSYAPEAVRVARTADGARVVLYSDYSLRVGRATVLPGRTPINRAFTLFNAIGRFEADEVADAACVLDEVEAIHEEVGGWPHDILLMICGKAA